MKKIVILLSLLALCGCSNKNKEPEKSESIFTDVTTFKYKEHQYIGFRPYSDLWGVVHDPDCPCMINYE